VTPSRRHPRAGAVRARDDAARDRLRRARPGPRRGGVIAERLAASALQTRIRSCCGR